MTPEEWSYHEASYRLDPWGDDWERSSMVATQIVNAIRGVMSGLAGKPLEDKNVMPHDALVPFRELRDMQKERLAATVAAYQRENG